MAAQPPLIAALNQLFRVVRDQDDETKRTAASVVRGHLVATADKATQTEPAEVRLDRLLESGASRTSARARAAAGIDGKH